MDIEKLESLPKHTAMHRHRRDGTKKCRCSYCDERHGEYVPYDRIRRWLTSRVGKYFNSVIHEFTHLDWVPKEKRTYRFLCDFVETNTFKTITGIKFYDSAYHQNAERDVNDCWEEVFYVHPKTGILCHKPRNSRVRYSQRQAKELATWFVKIADYDQLIKLGGVWYHVYSDPTYFKVRHQHLYDPNRPLLYDEPAKKKHFYGPFDPMWQEYLMWRPPVFKRQLSHEALKAYNLKNDSNEPVFVRCKVCGGNNCALHPI